MNPRRSISHKSLILMAIIFFHVLSGITSSEAQTVKYSKESVFIKINLLPKGQLNSLAPAFSRDITFSGKAEKDFDFPETITVEDPGNIANEGRDVFIEDPPAPAGTSSGWDIKTIYFNYNQSADIMYVGFHIYTDPDYTGSRTICGDADCDNNPGRTSDWLRKMQGRDFPDLQETESIVLLIDTDNDGQAQVAIGINQSTNLTNLKTFAAYKWNGTKFKYPSDPDFWGEKIGNVTVTLAANPDSINPDLEFTIYDFLKLPGVKTGPTLTFRILAFAGSDEDAGIGDDYIPDKTIADTLEFYFSDYGDAPLPYPTLFEDDGAYHDTTFNLYLGRQAADADSNGMPTVLANGDDITKYDDEDGVASSQHIVYEGATPQINVFVTNRTNKTAYIAGWIDYNGNSIWEDTEKAAGSINGSGNVTLEFPQVPYDSVTTTYARFRVSTDPDSVVLPTGKAPDGEVEDYLFEIKRFRDFGDAPDNSTNPDDYPTLFKSNGAFHSFIPNTSWLSLGNKIDAEANGFQSQVANGDDINGIDDEDAFTSNVIELVEGDIPRIKIPVINNTGQVATISGWIDYNSNQKWEESEKADTTISSSGIVTLKFPKVPTDHGKMTYARFRISTDKLSVGKPDGWSPNGEVEDYQVNIEKYDFGDAPDPLENTPGRYPTLLIHDGARHKIDPELYMGEKIDQELDGRPTREADGDDTDLNGDDEDGIEPNSLILTGGRTNLVNVAVVNLTGKVATLAGWIDFDKDGVWDDDERADTTIASSELATLKFTKVPLNSKDTTYARFRISTDANIINNPDGVAPDGEVEDYQVFIKKFDFGDVPDKYRTLESSDGAFHEVGSAPYNLYLGDKIDPEGDGIPTDRAVGDDKTDEDDEDGILSAITSNYLTLIEGTKPEIQVKVFNNSGKAATVNGWIDFDGNAVWDSTEKASITVQSSPDSQSVTLIFDTIATNPPDSTYARFRISTDEESIFYPTGFAPDGEVEDYFVKIRTLYDYGDAPDPQYPTLLTSDGARHKFLPDMKKICLGKLIDVEDDGQPSIKADGDDILNIDDEDGLGPVVGDTLYFAAGDTPRVTINVLNETNNPYYVMGWIDSNGDGMWDQNERARGTIVSKRKKDLEDEKAQGVRFAKPFSTVTFNFSHPIPVDAPDITYARFRISTDLSSIMDPGGLAPDGEVEDYPVIIEKYDFGDAPDPVDSTAGKYPTLLVNNGARHKIDKNLFFGTLIDNELDGQPSSPADKDGDDEDGLASNPIILTAGPSHQVEIAVINTTGKLVTVVGWIDYDFDGKWTANEKADTTVNGSGAATLKFTQIPDNFASNTYARFRTSTDSSSISTPKGLAPDGEVEDYMVQIRKFDFGDAPDILSDPDDFPTFLESDGARHQIKEGFFLGNFIDHEYDGQPDSKAEGDDNNGIDDEDGVTFHRMPLKVCSPETLTVVASDSGKLDAWIDFNNDNDWDDPGEQIFDSDTLTLAPGDNILIFNVPCHAIPDSQSYARFRFSSEGGLNYDEAANDGEVEDYEVQIDGFDFGDAPNAYSTLFADHGAYHKIKPGFFLGNSIDAEFDGQPDPDAKGDNNNGANDEDGVTFRTPLIIGAEVQVKVIASDSGKLDAWIDFNADNDWADPREQVIVSEHLDSGTNLLTINVPDNITPMLKSFARFRFSSSGGLTFSGPANDGEVEDYAVEIIAADFGDAPDDSVYHYKTLLKNNGACHKIKPGFHLGAGVDAEGDGKQNPDASGDKDDGVTFKSGQLEMCQLTEITITASEAGFLNAWIDCDCSGDWIGSRKQIFAAEPLVKGSTVLTFTVPGGINPTSHTYFRFRFSSTDTLSYEGYTEDGEVEDYMVEIIGYDYGDAPDPFEDPPGSYYTRKDNRGARHTIDSRLRLGDLVDANDDGIPNIQADGDDLDLPEDDEDGLPGNVLNLKICTYPEIKIKVHNSIGKRAMVVGWIDFDGKVGWTDSEKATAFVESVGDTFVYLKYPNNKVPSWLDSTYVRFRISTDFENVDRPWGEAPDGEVEDYLVIISKRKAAEISSLDAIPENGTIAINWATNLEADCKHFVVYRSLNDSTNFVEVEHALVLSKGDSTAGAIYHFTDKPSETGTFYYKLECVSPAGYSNFYGPVVVELATTVKPESSLPKEYSLSQNYPNPFNPETQIQFALPKDGQVTIVIYDMLGRKVRTIVDEFRPAGSYHVSWDARNGDGNVVTNGIYLLRMKSGTFMKTMKMTLIK